MSRRPPTPTLFPYTTLFRSRREDLASAVRRLAQLLGEALKLFARQSDRKSTRLNSSHVKISYAVLCLKKTTERDPVAYLIASFGSRRRADARSSGGVLAAVH